MRKKINKKTFADAVYKLVKQIPYGRVMTYGQIAAILGHPRAAQYVGWCLHWADLQEIPCQRVVNRFGGLASGYPGGGRDAHRFALLEEKVKIGKEGVVDLKKYLWWPKEAEFGVADDFERRLKRIKK